MMAAVPLLTRALVMVIVLIVPIIGAALVASGVSRGYSGDEEGHYGQNDCCLYYGFHFRLLDMKV
jgi:hypothetical protein